MPLVERGCVRTMRYAVDAARRFPDDSSRAAAPVASPSAVLLRLPRLDPRSRRPAGPTHRDDRDRRDGADRRGHADDPRVGAAAAARGAAAAGVAAGVDRHLAPRLPAARALLPQAGAGDRGGARGRDDPHGGAGHHRQQRGPGGRARRDDARADVLPRRRPAAVVPARARQHRLRRRAQPRAARQRRRLSPGAQPGRRTRSRRARQRRALARRARRIVRRARRRCARPKARPISSPSATRRCSISSCAGSRRLSCAGCSTAGWIATSCAITSTPTATSRSRACRWCRARACWSSAGRSTSTGGFDPRYFLYFEDFDWSVRLAKTGQLVYLPSFRIVHHGGGAARKGWRHIRWFVQSGTRFYRRHGWRWF